MDQVVRSEINRVCVRARPRGWRGCGKRDRDRNGDRDGDADRDRNRDRDREEGVRRGERELSEWLCIKQKFAKRCSC